MKVGSYVGCLQSPSGECIEVLPKTQKTTPNEDDLRSSRRLLRTALSYVLSLTKDADNWRRANTWGHQLAHIEPYQQPQRELPHWQCTRLMQGYQAVKPWCELVINNLNPNFQQGAHRGIALMFRMEMLFERYVTHNLKATLA